MFPSRLIELQFPRVLKLKLSDNSILPRSLSPKLTLPSGAVAISLLSETAFFFMLVENIDFHFKARRSVFAFEPSINAVFIARMIRMLFKDRNTFPSKMCICCAVHERNFATRQILFTVFLNVI